MMTKKKTAKGEVWCGGCDKTWEVANKYAYMQCPVCKGYKVYAVGGIANHYAVSQLRVDQGNKNKEGNNNL